MTINDFNSKIKSLRPFPLLGKAYTTPDFVALDLSVSNKALADVNISNSDVLESFIWNHIQINNAKIAHGGYIEKRGIYNRSEHFNKQNLETERNIHLGLDLWIEVNSPIYAPLEGTLHSFNNNSNYGDYGPTLILKHQVEGFTFYTLYGHLSLSSLKNKVKGSSVKKGQQIATLGSAKVNGDYPPHLHFQVIIDIQNYEGDYPGVSSLKDLDFYKANCPNPKYFFNGVL
ncbi:peptidoglycan DD-metalloendopeptidase family protein [Winogradskyella litorisediminis]|uniref:Peptidoglycan DD-metalloendopeptidase family protein n=1 Tax=Winogradskyella litorisediminis TaxID=1156618 RepID=A0ABW3N8W7_9FLAO